MRGKFKCLFALYLLMYTVCGVFLGLALLHAPAPLLQVASISG